MNVTVNSWHYKVYRWWYNKKHYRSKEYSPDQANLCPYVRAILFWAPLRFLFSRPRVWYTLLTAAGMGVGLIYKFRGMAGLKSLFQGFLVFLMIIGITFVVMLIFYLIEQTVKYINKKRNLPEETSFISLLQARGRAWHDRVCPSIFFVKRIQ